jgi:hypothetical protein
MPTETGHASGRAFFDQAGNLNLNDASIKGSSGVALATPAQITELTGGGATTLHSHAGGGGPSTQTATVTTDANTFEVTWSFDLGHVTVAYVSVTLLAVNPDTETWGPAGGQIAADLERIEQSADGITWQAVPAVGWSHDVPYDGSQSLPFLGWDVASPVARHIRGLFHVADGSSLSTYAGSHHPTAQARIDLTYL